MILLLERADNAVQVMLILADDLDGIAVIQAHHAQDALCIGNAALHLMHADIVITLGGSRHDSLDLSKIGNLDLFHHNKEPPIFPTHSAASSAPVSRMEPGARPAAGR